MEDLILNSAVICIGLSSIHLGTLANPLRYAYRTPRITDNIAIIGKASATFLALAVLIFSGNVAILLSTIFHGAGLHLFAKKTALKGKLFVWSTPYEMKSWEQRSIDSSRTSVLAAFCTLLANATMIIVGVYLYRNR